MKYLVKTLALGPTQRRFLTSVFLATSPKNSWFFSLPLFCLAIGCNGTPAPQDASVADLMTRERVMPPDGLTTADGDGGGWNGNVGTPCTTDEPCTGQTECLVIDDIVGLCSLSHCTMEDINTPEREDNCPVLVGGGATVCTEVPVSDDQGETINMTYCLPKCMPEANRNPCTEMGFEGLACDPLSILLNGHSEVCLFPVCKTHEDCGNKNPTNPNALCVKETGTCEIRGEEGIPVGSPCTISTDCGPAQFCFAEFSDEQGQVFAEGGYCTKIGCAYGGPWTCPEESKCFSMANAMSLCLVMGCNSTEPPDSNGCRDEATTGQYSCIKLGADEVCWLDLASK